MKTRKCFVSNSSSASYIITIYQSESVFCEFLKPELWWTCKNTFRKKLEEELAELNNRRSNVGIENDTRNDAKTLEKMIVRTHEFMSRLAGAKSDMEALIVYFEHSGVSVYSDDEHHRITLKSSVAMHNDYLDMPNIMKAVALAYLFSYPDVIRCERKDSEMDG